MPRPVAQVEARNAVITGPGTPDRGQRIQELSEGQQKSTTLVRFELLDSVFAVDLAQIGSVVEAAIVEWSRSDEDPSIVGAIRAGDRSIPIRRPEGAGDEPIDAASNKVIVLRGNPAQGVLVDRILPSRTVNESDIVPIPDLMVSRIGNTAVGGVVWASADDVELLFDVDAMRDHDSKLDMETQRRVRVSQRYGKLDHTHSLEVRIGDRDVRWSIPMSVIRHIADYRPPLVIPNARSDVRGMLSWQKHPIPLIDPTELLGVPEGVGSGPKVIVIGPPNAPSEVADCAILVTWVHGLHTNLRVDGNVTRDAAGRELRVLDVPTVVGG